MIASRAIAIVVILQLVACARQKSNVVPPELALHAKELVADGEASVYGDKGEIVEVDADAQIDVRIVEGDLQTPARLTIRELVAGCVDDTAAPACTASRIGPDPITVRSKLKFDGSRAATTITFGVMGGALGACIAMCQQGDELARGLAYGGLGAVGVFGLMVLIFAVAGD